MGDAVEQAIADFSSGRRRIVELGGRPYVHSVFPQATDFFCTMSTRTERAPERGLDVLTPVTWLRMRAALQAPELGLIVLHVNRHAAWSPPKLARSLFNRRILRGDFPMFSLFGVHMVRSKHAPIAAVDQDDVPLLMKHNTGILDRSTAYFMREIPGDRWKLLMGTAHRDLPTPRLRRKEKWKARLAKIRPVSLGAPLGLDPAGMPHELEKTADLFFAGGVEGNSWLRGRGMAELERLRGEGLRIDVARERLPPEEFQRRCASAWLTWSPEGLGHDCLRHYEAALCGSVPLISRAPIERHRPYLHGRHAWYYDIEPGGLGAAVRAALKNRTRLKRMARAARQFVIANHTPEAVTGYLVRETLKAAGPGFAPCSGRAAAIG